MPRKTKPNGFLLFMMDFRKREERKGRIFRGGIQEVQSDAQCNQEWQTMAPDKKAEYNRRAKDTKQTSGKKTGTGECMDAVERARKRQIEFEQNMNDHIESTVAMAMEFGNLPTVKFNFIHSNWFHTRPLSNNELDYVPAEFAVSEFSLKEGVTNIYHQILKTEIRCGYTREAMETSQETHQIPWNLQCGEDRFEVMAENLREFLRPGMDGNKYPPLYTSGQIKAAVKALLKRMTTELNVADETFVVYDLEILFKHLRNAAMLNAGKNDNFQTVMAEYELIKDSFSFTPGLDCDYHKNLDGTSQFCSMSIVKRWGFTICDYCCENLGIKMEPGVHYPLKVHQDYSDSVSFLSEQIDVMQIQDTIGIKSMTGVSKEYRTKVSERTDAEEQKRRQEKRTVTVIKYGELASPPEPTKFEPEPPVIFPSPVIPTQEYQRPLRRPHSISHAHIAGKQKEEHSFDESEFPSLGVSVGRGRGNARRKTNEPRPGPGRGRGIALS